MRRHYTIIDRTALKRLGFLALIFTSSTAHAQVQCGAQPSVPADLQRTIQADIEGKAQIFSKLLGDTNIKGKVVESTNEVYQKYNNLDKAQIQQYMIWVSCQNIMSDNKLNSTDKSKLWIEIYQALARYRTCTRPEFGQIGWGQQETVQGTSGWRGGGYNPGAYCTDFTNGIIASRGLGNQPHSVDNVTPGEEQRRTGFLNSVAQYNYHCSATLHWSPIYNQRADPLCGPE